MFLQASGAYQENRWEILTQSHLLPVVNVNSIPKFEFDVELSLCTYIITFLVQCHTAFRSSINDVFSARYPLHYVLFP